MPITDGLRFNFVAGFNCGGTSLFGQAGDANIKVLLNKPRRVRFHFKGRFTRAIGDNSISLSSFNGHFFFLIKGPENGTYCQMIDVDQVFDFLVPAGKDQWALQGIDQTEGTDGTGYGEVQIEWPDGEPGNLAEFIDGFDARCYLPIPPAQPEVFPNPSPFDRDEWLRFSEFIVLTYDDMALASAAVQAYFNGTATIATVDNTSSLIPGSLIAFNDDMTVVLIPGTTNFQQICMQVLDPGVGLIDWGAYSSAAIWQSAYAAIQLRIAATGANPTGPIFLAGHSYGGAVAALLAANYRLFNSTRDVRLFTIGAPRAGDPRLATILASVKRTHLANAFDGVTGIPAVAGELTGLSWVLPRFLYDQWTASGKMGAQIKLTREGEFITTDDSQLDFAALVDLIIEIVGGLAIPPYVAHFSAEYVRRLKLGIGV